MQGVRLAFDIGKARIGVAACDREAILAHPVETIYRDGQDTDFSDICDLVAEYQPVEMVVGLPLLLSGESGAATKMARSYARRLAAKFRKIPVWLVDERLTSVDAHRKLSEAGRKTKMHRSVVDQAAAVEILRVYLEAAAKGTQIGQFVDVS